MPPSSSTDIKQQTSITDLGSYTCNPCTIGALIHVAGFVLSKREVYSANHIGSLRILGGLTKYRQSQVGAAGAGSRISWPKSDATPPSTAISTPTAESSSDAVDLYAELLDLQRPLAQILLILVSTVG
ncbi:hypothetical protein E4U13_007099 [Claviceps humidiphila]|uniref:Uncharacterized protein n=1 Tax=Claviceps humidiphila TaxID=1294629 RepID=A0A9P7TVG4_9HYPO|nr:hypothetical protein E4U13_007099 [Claviceps humidiphila]